LEIKVDLGGPGAEAAKELAAGGRGALRRAFGPALTDFGTMLSDQMKLWRFQNLLKIREKVDRLVSERNVPEDLLGALPFGDAMRTLEAASQEDTDEIQELWARLIVKAASETEEPSVNKVHIEILQSLTPADSALLDLLFPAATDRTFTSMDEIKAYEDQMNAKAERTWRRFGEEARAVSVQNLSRLRCITALPRPVNADHVLRAFPDRDRRIDGALVDPSRFSQLLTALIQLIYQAAGAIPYDATAPVQLHRQGGWYIPFGELKVPELNHMLTPLGVEFMKAVTLNESLEPQR